MNDYFFEGKVIPYKEGYSILTLEETEISCKLCGGPCHNLFTIRGSHIEVGDRDIRIVRCAACQFASGEPYFVKFHENKAADIVSPSGFSADLLGDAVYAGDGCNKARIASIEWIKRPMLGRITDEELEEWSFFFAKADPNWVGSPEWPACFSCGSSMSFLLQIDTLEASSLEIEPKLPEDMRYCINVEGGVVLYLFECKKCSVNCTVTQTD